MHYKEITPKDAELNVSKTVNPSAKYFLIPEIINETYWIVEKVLDCDTIIVKEESGQECKEIRLCGLD